MESKKIRKKEALFKALGSGLGGEMDWRDHAFSLSHTREYGIAIVFLAAIALQEPLGKMGPIPGQSINLL